VRDLRYIIKVQSLVRRQASRNATDHKRHDRIMQSATAVQTAWRGYYTCLRYQRDLLISLWCRVSYVAKQPKKSPNVRDANGLLRVQTIYVVIS
jgi:hypothetical protein